MSGGRTRRESDAPTRLDERRPSLRAEPSSQTRLDPVAPGALVVTPGMLIAGRYRALRQIAIGGYGEVHEVLDERSQRTCALKLTRHAGRNTVAAIALRAEFAMLASLHHPNLADVYDFGWFGDVAFFTQALVPGVRLDHAKLDLGTPRAVGLITQLCRALEYLHARGILHRDIKPPNVLVDLENEKLVLLDFGISQTFGSSDGHAVVGTLAYLAPEAVRGAPLDARSDLYALGVTLYRLAAGELPFLPAGREPAEFLPEVLLRPPPPLPDQLPKPIAEVILRLLAKDPTARFASAGEVIDALGTAIGRAVERETPETLAGYVLSATYVDPGDVLGRAEALCVSTPLPPPIVVVGDAGTGKSRLLRELKQRLQVRGLGWISVQVRHDDGAQPVRELADAVLTDEVVEELDPRDRMELARGLRRLRRRGEQIAIASDPERARQLRTEALGRALALRFTGRRGVVAFEDLHRADDATAAHVAKVIEASRAAGANCVFVVNARPGTTVDAFVEATGGTALKSAPLDAEGCRALVEGTFGDAELLTGTALGAALQSGAHAALWVQESLRLATERAHIVRARGRWRVVLDIPALGVEEVLLARVAGLRKRGRQLALACAIWGSPATAAELSRLIGGQLTFAVAELRNLVRAGIAEERRDAQERQTYTIHDRFAEVVPSLFPTEALREMHLRAADAQLADHPAAAASHLSAAGEIRGARAAYLAAAREAERNGRPDIALRWIDRAFAVAPDAVELRDHLLRYDVASTCGARDAADESLAWLQGFAGRSGAGDRFEVRLRAARRLVARGDGPRAREAANDAVLLARGEGDRRAEARGRLVAAEADWLFGSIEGSREGYRLAAAMATECDDAELAARAWIGASLTAIHTGRMREALDSARLGVRAAGGSTDLALRSDAERQLGNVTRETGHIARARTHYRLAVKNARAAGCIEREAKALNNLGSVDHWLGNVTESLEAFTRSIELKERAGVRSSALVGYNNIAALQNALGQFEAARVTFERILASAEADFNVIRPVALSNLGDLEAVTGDLDGAIEHYREALAASRGRALVMQQTHALANLTRTLLMRAAPGDREAAGAHLKELAAIVVKLDVPEATRRLFAVRSVAFSVEGKHQDALADARLAAKVKDRLTRFSDLFNTPIEARWIYALALARSGQHTQAQQQAAGVRRELSRMSSMLEDVSVRDGYLRGHPLHAAILAGNLDLPPGRTWPVAAQAASTEPAR